MSKANIILGLNLMSENGVEDFLINSYFIADSRHSLVECGSSVEKSSLESKI